MDFEAQELHKRFGDKKVLEGISLAASGGHALGLLGRNGAGKTTTIRIIMGVFPADSGRILWGGSPLDRSKVRIGYLPEEHGLYPKQIISEQLIYLAELRGMRRSDAKVSVRRWLERLGVGEHEHKRLDTLSKGNQQKIQLCACLMTDPEFVILDEPFSGLDPVNAAILKDVVGELIKEGKIVIFSSHQMNYVEEFCENIAILHHGSIVLGGGIGDIKRSYKRDTLRLRGVQAEQLRQLCRGALGDSVKNVTERRNDLLVVLKGPELKNQFIGSLLEAGVDFDGAEVFEPSLNDIFVEYTGDDVSEREEVAV